MKKVILIILLLGLVQLFFAQSINNIKGWQKMSNDGYGRLYYYFIRSTNNNISIKNIEIELSGFDEGIKLKIGCINIITKDTIFINNVIVTNQSVSIPISSLLNGVYYLQLINPDNLIKIEKKKLFFIENLITYNYRQLTDISNLPFEFSLTWNSCNYPNSKGTNSDTIIDWVKKCIKEAWKKENNEWDFCNALPNNLISVPKDTFHVFLNNQYPIWLFNGDSYFNYRDQPENSMQNSDITSLLLSSDIVFWGSYNNILIPDEKAFYLSTTAHEMLHSIQSSYLKPYSKTEKEKRYWHREGQARLIETVIMEDNKNIYNGQNILFLEKTTKTRSLYSSEVETFMRTILQNQLPLSLDKIGYNYSIFWRYLFEHNFALETSTATRMALIRETMRTLDTSYLPTIKEKMTAALQKTNGKFKTFDAAITDFAQRIAFYEKTWKDSAGILLNNWQDPNGNDFYGKIAQAFTKPCETLDDFCFKKDNYILNTSFGFVCHRFVLNRKGSYAIRFNSDPDGNKQTAAFNVRMFISRHDSILLTKECTLVQGSGNVIFSVVNPSILHIIVTRLDTNEGKNSNYGIEINPADTLKSAYTVTAKQRGTSVSLAFTNQTKGLAMSRVWKFGDGQTSAAPSPSHTYSTSGVYSVQLTSSNCSDTSVVLQYSMLTLLPYITKVNIYPMGISGGNNLYTRTCPDSLFTFTQTLNMLPTGRSTMVQATISGKLKKLAIVITDAKNKVTFSDSLTAPTIQPYTWSFGIPSGILTKGVNYISFKGLDIDGNNLLCGEKPASYPYRLYTNGKYAWSSPVTDLTGTDNNYRVFVTDGAETEDITCENETVCTTGGPFRVYFKNNSTYIYTVDFGDKSTTYSGFSPGMVLTHDYPKAGKYKAKFKINSIEKTVNVKL
jgi:PKD repeat protein